MARRSPVVHVAAQPKAEPTQRYKLLSPLIYNGVQHQPSEVVDDIPESCIPGWLAGTMIEAVDG